MKSRSITFFAICSILSMMLLPGCTNAAGAEKAAPAQALSYTLSTADLTTTHSEAADISVTDNGRCLISEGGVYRLSGPQEGQICIDVQDEIVYLILEDAELHSDEGPAIYVKSAAKVVMTIPQGTETTLSDSAYYAQYPEAEACVFSCADLTVNGGGTLYINSYFGDALRTKEYLKVLGSSVIIRSKGDALRGNDGIVIQDSHLDLQCENIGIHTTKLGKAGRGYAVIQGGSLSIIAGEYGIYATENLSIQDCSANIYGVIGHISALGTSHIQEGSLS